MGLAELLQDRLATGERNAGTLAITGLYGFAFFAPWSIAGGQLFQVLLLVVTILQGARNHDWAKREPLVWITGAFCLYVLVRYGVAILERPDLRAEHWDGAYHWLKSGPLAILVVAVGFMVAGDWHRHLPRVLALWLLGAGINVLRHLSPDGVLKALTGGARYDFGQQYNESGVMYSAALLLVIVFAPRLVHTARTRWARVCLATATLVLLTLLAIVLVVLKTRTAWIALAMALLVMALYGTWIWWRSPGRNAVRMAKLVAAGLVVVLMLGAVFGGQIARRWSEVADTVAAVPGSIVQGDIEGIRDDTVGKRLAFLVFAGRAFLDRPVFGYGPADVRYLLEERPVPWQIEGMRAHLHSGYSQIFNRFGIVGGLPIIVLVVIVFLQAQRLMRDPDGTAVSMGLLAASFTVFMLTHAITEQRLEDFDVVQVYSLILGMALAPSLIARSRAGRDSLVMSSRD